MATRKPDPKEPEVQQPVEPQVTPETKEPEVQEVAAQDAEPIKQFILRHEDAAQALGAVVVHISHPHASGDIYQGRDAGIRTSEGPQQATYSDGSKH